MLRAAVLTVLLTARAQVAKFEFPVTKESMLFITVRRIISKVLCVMKMPWCDGFYLICERCEPLVVRVCRLRDKL